MPTHQDLSNLTNNCDWTWTTTNGVEVKEKKSAVKTTIDVTPPNPSAPAQFFRVGFGD